MEKGNTEEERCVKRNGVLRGNVDLKTSRGGQRTEEERSDMNRRNTEEEKRVKRNGVLRGHVFFKYPSSLQLRTAEEMSDTFSS